MRPETHWLIVVADAAKQENEAEIKALRAAVEKTADYCPTCDTTPCMLPPETA